MAKNTQGQRDERYGQLNKMFVVVLETFLVQVSGPKGEVSDARWHRQILRDEFRVAFGQKTVRPEGDQILKSHFDYY